jgi:hypothetical protein
VLVVASITTVSWASGRWKLAPGLPDQRAIEVGVVIAEHVSWLGDLGSIMSVEGPDPPHSSSDVASGDLVELRIEQFGVAAILRLAELRQPIQLMKRVAELIRSIVKGRFFTYSM